MERIFKNYQNVNMHTPVLLKESIEALNIKPSGKYIDATYGLGGHSKAIVEKGGNVLALDWDKGNVENHLKKGLPKNITLIYGNYANIKHIAEENHWTPCQGIIFDLGLSMDQIRSSQRGFSYEARSEPLDMRIDVSQTTTAADIVNSLSADDLYGLFTQNAEEISSRPIAEALNKSRRVKSIQTVGDLLDSIETVTKDKRVVARIFQAIRVEVNDEFNNIRRGLQGAFEILDKQGRIVIITFHQSEDRIVKMYARKNNMSMMTKKPLKSSSGFSFERSAKLRIIEK